MQFDDEDEWDEFRCDTGNIVFTTPRINRTEKNARLPDEWAPAQYSNRDKFCAIVEAVAEKYELLPLECDTSPVPDLDVWVSPPNINGMQYVYLAYLPDPLPQAPVILDIDTATEFALLHEFPLPPSLAELFGQTVELDEIGSVTLGGFGFWVTRDTADCPYEGENRQHCQYAVETLRADLP